LSLKIFIEPTLSSLDEDMRDKCSALRLALLIALVAPLALAIMVQPPVHAAPDDGQLSVNMDFSMVAQHVATIAGFGSRMTGYPGYYKTLNYLYNYLKGELGLNVVNHTYTVLVPVEEESYVEVLKPFHARIKAYSLYPNGVNPSSTPPEGLTGQLIYVGKGRLNEFNGKDVSGSIVAMEFNSQSNWLNAAKLGAKAVIFIEPNSTTYYECDSKFLDTPLNFPRLYVTSRDWEVLRSASEVRVVSRVKWREVTATNLVAVINGSSSSDVVILSSHFDSWSVVPGLASSKTEAVPLAMLLEYARHLRSNPPSYTVWLVFLSGHWQALAGAREFIEDNFFTSEVQGGKVTIWGWINFDMFSSDSDGLQLLHASYYTLYGGNSMHGGAFPSRLSWFMEKVNQLLSQEPLRSYILRHFNITSPVNVVSAFFTTTGFWGTEPIPYMLDSEPASISGIPAFSITTRHSGRLYVGIPVDDGKYADVGKLAPLIQIAAELTDGLLRTQWGVNRRDLKPTRFELASIRGYPGFTTLNVRAVEYNFTKGWYEPVPNALVELQLINSNYKLNKIVVRVGDDGRAEVHGIPQSGTAAGGGTVTPFSQWVIRGWLLDEDDNILMATDLGQFGMQNFPRVLLILHGFENATVVLAKAGVAELFDAELPSTLITPAVRDPRTGYFDWWRQAVVIVQPYDILTKSIPLSFGFYWNGWEPVALVWTQPELTYVIVGFTGVGGQVSAGTLFTITNSTSENTEGFGLKAVYGKPTRITLTALREASDMYYVSYGRYRAFLDKHVGSPSADATLAKAGEYLEKALKAYEERLYSEAYAYALVARAYAYKAYTMEVMPLVNDAAKSMLFMFPLVIFAGFFLEKITLHSEGIRRLGFIVLVASFLMAFFVLIHPAFGVLSNISLGLLGSLIMIVLFITFAMLLAEGESVRSTIETRILGVHRSEVSRMDTMMTAFSIGSEYIRRRPLRAVLMLITIIIMTLALTSFTSVMPARITLPVLRQGYTPQIDEILLKNGRGVPPGLLSTGLIDVVRVLAGDQYTVLPRAWVYPPVDRETLSVVFPVLTEAGKNATIPALIGITPEEYDLLYSKATLGVGIRFEDANHAVISRSLAQNLSLSLGDKIFIAGQEFTVFGIIDAPEIVDTLVESDGYNTLPADPMFFQPLAKDVAVAAQAGTTPPNLGAARVVIIPFYKALELNGYVASIALVPKPGSRVSFDMAREISYALDVQVWYSIDKTPFRASTFSSIAMGGWEMIVMVLVIGALNVAIMVLGNLKERTREIYVFSAVGLSPLGITIFFIAEVLVYVMVGTVLGYLAGYATTSLMMITGALPSEHVFNFASVFSIIGTLTVMAAALAAVIYPSYVAARIITPSLERRWKPPTKPRGTEWEIPLPMSVPTEEEAKGVLAYLYEYYRGAGAVREGIYVVREMGLPNYPGRTITLTMALSPIEAGVTQTVDIFAVRDMKLNRYTFVAKLHRTSGSERMWVDSNYRYIDDLRKQLLMWSSLTAESRKKYISEATRG